VFSGSIENKEGAVRTIDTNAKWLRALKSALSKNCVLIINTESLNHAKALKREARLKELDFTAGFVFTTHRYENAIVVLTNQASNTKSFMENMVERFGKEKTQRYIKPFILERF
jgi:hypothetical protein